MPEIFILPHDKEIVNSIIKGACVHNDINRSVLLTGTSKELVTIRYQCMYLISTNTALSDKQIAGIFEKSRSTIQYGVGIIEVHKKIYRQTFGTLKAIVEITNSFTKKYQWQLQLNNTML